MACLESLEIDFSFLCCACMCQFKRWLICPNWYANIFGLEENDREALYMLVSVQSSGWGYCRIQHTYLFTWIFFVLFYISIVVVVVVVVFLFRLLVSKPIYGCKLEPNLQSLLFYRVSREPRWYMLNDDDGDRTLTW